MKLVCAISLGILLFADGSRNLQDSTTAPPFCDIIETNGSLTVCVISTDHSWSSGNEIPITPDSIRVGNDPDRPQLPSEAVNAIRVAPNTVLENKVYLGELSISGFESVIIDGTLRASKVTVLSEGNIALEDPGSSIDTAGKGYASARGPGKGYLATNKSGCSIQRGAGASHLGRGGVPCGFGRPSTTYDLQGNDFGSGGISTTCSGTQQSQGGGIVSLFSATTITLAETAIINANAAPQGFCSGQCSGGSGGSIKLAAPSIFGAGQITARGAGARGGGGGGFIGITADDFEITDFIVNVSGGEGTLSCSEAIGEAGLIKEACFTSVCGEYGMKLPDGQCGCKCEELWSGGLANNVKHAMLMLRATAMGVAQSCRQEVLLTSSADAIQTGMAARVPHFATANRLVLLMEFVPKMAVSATAIKAKSVTTVFAMLARWQIQHPPHVPAMVFAMEANALAMQVGQGVIVNFFVIALAMVLVISTEHALVTKDLLGRRVTLSQNCLPSPERYCADKANTAAPCLPGILKAIGYGWDRLRGSLTPHRLVSLTFVKKSQVFFGGKRYEIPDQVTVQPIDEVSNSFDTFGFLNTRDLREYMATSVDAGGVFKGVEMGLSSEYTNLVQKSFKQERTLYISTADYQLYTVKLDESLLDESVSTKALEIKEKFIDGDNRLVPNLGTDYVNSVILGGRVEVNYFVDLTVVAELSSTAVRAEANTVAQDVTYAPAFDGSVESVVENNKSCFARRATFTKTITGGDKALSFKQSLESGFKGLAPWRDSVAQDPGMLKLTTNSIEYIFPDMGSDVTAYIDRLESINGAALKEIDLNENLDSIEGSVCDDPSASSCCTLSLLVVSLLFWFSLSLL
ncbi:MAG: hypothetical protein SGBAC_011200 [Bacillariaceae sp.]